MLRVRTLVGREVFWPGGAVVNDTVTSKKTRTNNNKFRTAVNKNWTASFVYHTVRLSVDVTKHKHARRNELLVDVVRGVIYFIIIIPVSRTIMIVIMMIIRNVGPARLVRNAPSSSCEMSSNGLSIWTARGATYAS